MSKSFGGRIVGAAMLDVATYQEVEADVTATTQAAGVVGLVAVAGIVGGVIDLGHGWFSALLAAFGAWTLCAGVTYLVGTKCYGGTGDWSEMMRTLGFAQAPGLLAVLAILPGLGAPVSVVIGIWTLVASVIAIREALHVSTADAIATVLVPWVVMFGVGLLLLPFLR